MRTYMQILCGALLLILTQRAQAQVQCGTNIPAFATTYLTQNVLNCSGTAIRMSPGSTLNCQGHKIQGTYTAGSTGILLLGDGDVSISNCDISQFSTGILIKGGADTVNIKYSTIHHNTEGIVVSQGSKRVEIRSSLVQYNTKAGFRVSGLVPPVGYDYHHGIHSSFIGNGAEGINLTNTNGNTFQNCTVLGNGGVSAYLKNAKRNSFITGKYTRIQGVEYSTRARVMSITPLPILSFDATSSFTVIP